MVAATAVVDKFPEILLKKVIAPVVLVKVIVVEVKVGGCTGPLVVGAIHPGGFCAIAGTTANADNRKILFDKGPTEDTNARFELQLITLLRFFVYFYKIFMMKYDDFFES